MARPADSYRGARRDKLRGERGNSMMYAWRHGAGERFGPQPAVRYEPVQATGKAWRTPSGEKIKY